MIGGTRTGEVMTEGAGKADMAGSSVRTGDIGECCTCRTSSVGIGTMAISATGVGRVEVGCVDMAAGTSRRAGNSRVRSTWCGVATGTCIVDTSCQAGHMRYAGIRDRVTAAAFEAGSMEMATGAIRIVGTKVVLIPSCDLAGTVLMVRGLVVADFADVR